MGDPGDDLVKAITSQLRAHRKAKGITQEVIAERLHIAVQSLRRLESGRQNLTLKMLARFARAIGVRLEVELIDVGPGKHAPTKRNVRKAPKKATEPAARARTKPSQAAR